MTYEIYRYIFIGGAILAGIMLAVSILVFFLLNIPNVIGDLTGANARKAIENIRNLNENSGDKAYNTSAVNLERGKITDKISNSGRIVKNPSGNLMGAMNTEKIGTARLNNQPASETVVLDAPAAETTVLGAANETTVLGTGAAETTLLSPEAPAYAVPEAVPQPAEAAPAAFVVEYEITYIHTNEVIA